LSAYFRAYLSQFDDAAHAPSASMKKAMPATKTRIATPPLNDTVFGFIIFSRYYSELAKFRQLLPRMHRRA